MYAYWSDLNLHNHTVRVTHKPDRGWTPKAYKEREIPIPQPLVDALKAYKTKADKTCNLLFPTAQVRIAQPKHAVLGFTESLRTELLHDKSKVHLGNKLGNQNRKAGETRSGRPSDAVAIRGAFLAFLRVSLK